MNLLNVGDELFDPGANCLVMKVLDPTPSLGRINVLEANSQNGLWILYEELRGRIVRGELEVRRTGNPSISVFIDRQDQRTCERKVPRKSTPGAKEDVYLSSAARATRVVRLVNDYCRRNNASAYAAYSEVRKTCKTEFPDLQFPSLATVYRLLERDRCNAPLVTSNHLKGNRTERHSQDMVEHICMLARAVFLKQGSRWSLSDFADHARRSAVAVGLLGAQDALSKKYVRKVIVTRLYAMPEVSRLLNKDRAAKASVASHRIRVDGILQRVEQDSVHLPFIVQTPDGICSDVWLTHSIDCATSNVSGWRLKIGAPNESDGLGCIEVAMFSKGPQFKYFGVDDATDLYGVPALLVLDNGAEARGERMRRLTQLGVDFVYCKSRHPQKKPFIERLNRSLKEALQTLPGCTRMDGKDGARDPVALGDDLMTLDELERYIVHWYFHKWADQPLERFVDEDVFEDRALGITPSQRYKNIVERQGCPLPLPPNRSDWLRIKYHLVSRTLSMKTGITVGNFEFKGDNLQRLIERFGEQAVDVLYDPEDFRRVYVIDGEQLIELLNQSAGECTPAYSFSVAKEMKSSLNSLHPETARSAAFTQTIYVRSSEPVKKAGKQRKSPNRAQKKEVVAQTRSREAVERAAQHPLPAPTAGPLASGRLGSLMLDDVGELPTCDRTTGALL